MTNTEFQNRWVKARPILHRMLKAYIEVEEYKTFDGIDANRIEMAAGAIKILQDNDLVLPMDIKKMAELCNGADADSATDWFYHRVRLAAGLGPGGLPLETIAMEFKTMPVVRIRNRDWFKRKDFMDFVCDARTATWHRKLKLRYTSGSTRPTVKQNMMADDLSDVFITWDGPYDGSNSCCGKAKGTLPEDIWEFICEMMWQKLGYRGEALIWISNLTP